MPVELSAEGWAALDAADPAGAAHLERANGQWFCVYGRARLTADQAATLCGGPGR